MANYNYYSDYLIIGSGIIGLTIAYALKEKIPTASINIIEKEDDVAQHSSGRNSGVLHSGFYYSEHSLKAKFTKDGNRLMQEYCAKHNLKINKCGKVVVAKNKKDHKALLELEKRGKANQIEVTLIDDVQLKKIEQNAKTYQHALFSPTTASIDPIEICQAIKRDLLSKGVNFFFNNAYFKRQNEDNVIITNKNLSFCSKKIINCAGLYADKVAADFGHSQHYTIIPFKGIYLKYSKSDMPIKMNIYPVPNLKNPFLGVHYTITADKTIKIGPTAIPAFWRENYQGFKNFNFKELRVILLNEILLFIFNSFNFRSLVFEEVKKYNRFYFISLAKKLVHKIDGRGFDHWSTPGIRAQLMDTRTRELVQDFVVESDATSVHILNAVSPAFTCSFAFSRWVVDNYIVIE